MAQEKNLAYLNLNLLPIERDSLGLIPQTEAERANVVIIQRKGQTLRLGALDASNQETIQIIKNLKAQGFKTEIFVISHSSFKKALAEYQRLPSQSKKTVSATEIVLEQINIPETFSSLKERINQLTDKDTSVLVETFLGAALKLEASDIHIEPQKENTQIRFRLDGVLQEAGSIPDNIYQFALSRLKLLSSLQINVQNVPQDGRFTIKQRGETGEKGEVEIEVRTSILPGAYGEYIVLRILNPNAIKLEIKDLGLKDYFWQIIEKELKKPSGIILVTGPTGSGKTTTLYAFLKHLNRPGIKIVTLEDPIEYHLTGINQSQIEPEKGYTFAQGLRSVLRQDPDIILVGEIRDEETADVALHSALTGHLVFSTLHTNDAIGTIPRFLDLNAKPPILASALNAVIAQRLVRKLCGQCKKEIAIDKNALEKIKKELFDSAQVKKIFSWPDAVKIYQPVGCAHCGNTGYKGRIGIFEILPIDQNMEQLIAKNPSHQEVLAQVKNDGFIFMYQDGLMKIIEGVTTLEEVGRVTSAEV